MQNFTKTAITLHWLIFFLILAAALIGLSMVDLPFSPKRLQTYSYHKWLGVTVFFLVLARIAWRITHTPPALPEAMPAWERIAAHATHFLLYILIVVIPITGWLYSSAAGVQTVYLGYIHLPDLIEKNKELAQVLKLVHRYLNYTLFAVIALHVAAAFKHYLIDRDNVFTQILPLLKPLNKKVSP